MHGFAFDAMPEEQLAAVKKELRIIIFPGSTILCKRLQVCPPPTPQPPRHTQVGTHLHLGFKRAGITGAEVGIVQLRASVQPETRCLLMLQATEDGGAAGSEDSDQAAEPALQLLHAHPAVASRPESDAAPAPPAQHDEQHQQPAQAAVADASRDVVRGSAATATEAAPAPSTDGLCAVSPPDDGTAAPAGGPAPAAETSAPDPTGAGAADLVTAATDPASTAAEEPVAAASSIAAAVPPISAESEPTAAASDLPADGTAAAAGDTAAAVPSSPRR
jgi:hypothetical protein